MTAEDRIGDILLAWEDALEQGRDVPATELCKDCPELVGDVTQRIESLKRTAWLLKLAQNPPAPAPASALQPGQIISDRYRLDRQVGVGGFGEVWEGFDLELQRRVAVKAPRLGRASDHADRFLAEARRLARLKRPGIVAVYDVVREEGQCFIITEFIEGTSLAERLRQGRPTIEEAVRIVTEIAGHLAFAHEQNFIHQDVKPGNILLAAQGRAYLTDFGIAGTVEEVNADNRTSIGTLAYSSPEQIAGKSVDARTDIYSLGVVLFELLTGQRPFEADSPPDLRNKVLHGSPPLPRSLNPTVPKPLEVVCFRCLAKSPAERYSTAQALADDLSRCSARRRGVSWPIWVAAALLVGGIVAGLAVWRGHNQTKRTDENREVAFGPEEDLFNGKDLAGWAFHGQKRDKDEVLTVEDGVLTLKGARHYHLRSEQTFKDFRVRLTYRFPVGGATNPNGAAVLLRMTTKDRKSRHTCG